MLYQKITQHLLLVLVLMVPAVWAKPATSVEGLFKLTDISLYLQCYGKGEHTVVVHSGFNSYGSAGYWLKVINLLPDNITFCVYDRANLGESEKLSDAYDFAIAARQLHELLEKAEIKPPYIMFGHSYGSYPVRIFNDLYPKEVSAIMLIDPSQYGQWANKMGKWQLEVDEYSEKMKAHYQEELLYWRNPKKNPEWLDLRKNEQLIRKAKDFGALPYVLLWAKDSDVILDSPSKDFHLGTWYRMYDMYHRATADMRTLSSNAKVVYADTSKHYVQLHHPELIVEQLAYLLEQIDAKN